MQTICMDGQCLTNYLSIALNGKNMFKFNGYFIKNYDEDSDKGYILEVDIKHPKNLRDLHSDLPFLHERVKINKCNKFVCNLFNKKTMLFT